MDTLTGLRAALKAQEEARTELRELQSRQQAGVPDPRALAADIRRQSGQLSSAEAEAEKWRSKLASDKARAEAEKADVEQKLQALAAAKDESKAGVRHIAALRDRLVKATALLAAIEKGLAAQSSGDIPAVVSSPSGRERATAEILEDPQYRRYTHVESLHWPGATVPERIMMLVRETKTDSRRPIVISSIVVATLTVVLLGVTLISGAINPDGRTSIGKGELYVPVLAADADDVGTLQMTIEFDAAVLSGISASAGPAAENAVVECNLETPGRMVLRLIDATGMSGDGAVMLLRFRVNDIVPRAALLDVTAASAKDSLSLRPVAVEFEDGSVNTATLESVAPVVRFPAAS